jgi:hypothetical protein
MRRGCDRSGHTDVCVFLQAVTIDDDDGTPGVPGLGLDHVPVHVITWIHAWDRTVLFTTNAAAANGLFPSYFCRVESSSIAPIDGVQRPAMPGRDTGDSLARLIPGQCTSP